MFPKSILPAKVLPGDSLDHIKSAVTTAYSTFKDWFAANVVKVGLADDFLDLIVSFKNALLFLHLKSQ